MTAETQPVRLVVVDDHPFVREGLRSYLCDRPSLKIVGEAADGRAAINLARRIRPDVVLMDVNLPGLSGLSATETLRRELPGIRVLMLSVHTRMEYVLQMIRSGAHGYVAKDAAPSELVRAIMKVAKGGTYFSQESALAFLRDQLAAPNCIAISTPEKLSRREREVLSLLAEGQTNKQMAAKFGVSVRTIETHRERLKQKLGLRTVAELTRFALSHELTTDRAPRGK